VGLLMSAVIVALVAGCRHVQKDETAKHTNQVIQGRQGSYLHDACSMTR